MKKIIFPLLFLFVFATSLLAQKKNTSKIGFEKIRSLKVGFITQKLDLSSKEAEKFWPIYNTYDKKIMLLRKEENKKIRKKINAQGGVEAIKESEAKEILEQIKKLKKEQVIVIDEYQTKLTKVLPYKKILILNLAEKEFNRTLLRKLRNKNRVKNKKKD
ncbi:sensor of ECF-type sigma factor [Lutibacter sp. Hel_I_33_5]|uniref:sensor of ECF-type sigma factor n=1 Tax=Lutibacter sp. Hel_I_33_5 TaxID=1566289 RepID=UPI0011A8B8D6|nr:sensor of ECF-type sigma factor [Lutibacter sp. Hel_I_33_5]